MQNTDSKVSITGHSVANLGAGELEIKTVTGAIVRIKQAEVVDELPIEAGQEERGVKRFSLPADATVWLKLPAADFQKLRVHYSPDQPDGSTKKWVDDGSTESKSRDDDADSTL